MTLPGQLFNAKIKKVRAPTIRSHGVRENLCSHCGNVVPYSVGIYPNLCDRYLYTSVKVLMHGMVKS